MSRISIPNGTASAARRRGKALIANARSLALHASHVFLVALVLLTPCVAPGETINRSVTTFQLPAAIEPGKPVGSFALDGLISVDPYRGSASISIPLIHVRGRGGAQFPIAVSVPNTTWRIETSIEATTHLGLPVWNYYPIATPDWYTELASPYGPGIVFVKSMGKRFVPESECIAQPSHYRYAYSQVVFRAPNGSEHVLTVVGNSINGLPLDRASERFCTAGDYLWDRGTRFEARDGSGYVFEASYPIVDYREGDLYPGNDVRYVSGVLYSRDGSRSGVDSSRIVWTEDRNGNRLVFDYDAPSGSQGSFALDKITDSLGRDVEITNGPQSQNPRIDTIEYRGENGQLRPIQIVWRDWCDLLKLGSGDCATTDLFPEISGQTHGQALQRRRIGEIILPDGRKYQFEYNLYGEVTRVVLPTGGVIELDYAAGVRNTYASGQLLPAIEGMKGQPDLRPLPLVYRRVITQRVFGNAGDPAPVRTTTWSRPGEWDPSSGAFGYVKDQPDYPIEVTEYNGEAQAANLASRSIFRYRGSSTDTRPSVSPALSVVGPAFSSESDPLVPYVLPYEGKEKKVQLFGSAAQSTELLQSTETEWTELAERRGVVPSETKTTLYGTESDQAVTATTKSTHSYDNFGNPIELREYAYSSGEPTEVLRTTVREYETAAGSPYIDLANGVYLSSLLKKETVTGGGVQSETSYHHDDYSVFGLIPRGTVSGHNAAFDPSKIRRGNATRIVQRRDSSSTIEWKQQFDVLGNLVKQVNPLNHATDFAFDDCFLGSGTAAQPATPTFAFSTQITNALGHSAHYCFDYQLGAIRTFSDPNAVVTQYQYGGALDRLVSVAEAEGTSVERRHRFVYDDVNRTIVSESNKDSVSAYPIRTTIRYDRLGRTTQTEQDDEQGTIYVTMEYDGLGRVSRTTHPYRQGEAQRWTNSQYDGLGRVVAVEAPDGATQTTTFIANRSRQTDPALKWREFTLDALGRMSSVKEGDGSDTNYGYDALGGLRTVAQSGQTRTFVYNDLGWLLSANNPESGLISYGHDALGNVTSRSMGGHITSYSFDAINRPLQVVYADFPAQNVTYAYHSQAPRIGRLASVSNSVSSTVYPVYDGRGRILESEQTFAGIVANGEPVKFGFQYGYDLAGNVTSMQLPSGRTIYTAWSSAGRALHVSGVRGETTTNYFASAATPALYAAHGALREAQWGNGLWERWEYLPERLQPWRVQVGSATEASSKGEWQFGYCDGSWGLSCASNNGNIVGQKILPVNVTQVYSFDALNRMSTASESGGGWFETYGFDVHGNLWWNNRSSSLGGPHLMRPDSAAWFANGRNRAVKPGELEAESFDEAGNLTKAGVLRLEYDGENRLAKAVGSGSTVYAYDGLGRRVTKQEAGGTLTYYVYDAFGGLAAEYLPTGPDSTVGTHYLSTDHLGSTRLVTNASGDVVSRHDYLPFGEEIPNTVGNRQSVAGYAWNGSLTQRFTGKERDAETSLDYFGARYLSAAMGRFTSPDPLLESGNPENSLSWNRYAYTFNNPLRFVDPNGLCSAPAVNPGETGVCIDLYISAPRINGIGHGDNRGPSPNNPSATYRQEIQLAINPADASVRVVKDDPGVSKATVLRIPESPAELMIKRKGESNTTVSPVTTDKDGNGHFSVYNEAINGLSALPGAPKDTIKTDLKFTFTPDGRVGLDPGGTRTAYPSLEIYRYDAQGRPSTILQVQEKDPKDLCCRNQVIPRVAPR